ncbi:ABC transporter permease [Dactylosporangium sp. AC04546]|uniref:ABC transporter permease n=1 Tax=Dactylosporangium sp. AC04546 TaxID=2862460 RepID=UPI001EDD7FAD|nr:ABC transporter permease [Dactylosporangium sp. AC04546]WVK78702.1 ABC transporter permease [Dactylosporangium sp. AC04546]
MLETNLPAPVLVVPDRPPLVRDLHAVGLLWRREVIRFRRNWAQIVLGLMTPLMFLFILGTGIDAAARSDGGGGYQAFLFPGVLLMAVQAPAVTVGASIVWDRQAGLLRQMLVAPVRRGALVVGICLGGATTGTLYGVAMLAFAGLAGVPYDPWRMTAAMLEVALTALAFAALAVWAAVSLRRPETFQMVVTVAMMPLLFLSGAMFPASGLPGWLGAAVLANPLTYAVDAVRRTLSSGFGDATSPRWFGAVPPVAVEVGLIALIALLALTLAARRFARAE